MKESDLIRIRHMTEAITTAISFVKDRAKPELETDRMLLFALVRAIEIIGEAATKVSQETRSNAPSVPWSSIVGMRNRLIHAYFDVDTDILWQTVTTELPELLKALETIVSKP